MSLWYEYWQEEIMRHKNKNMEYEGFKVGDKVEIANECFLGKSLVGVIKAFGDRTIGGFMEPDTLMVNIDGADFDILYLLRHNYIRKLPKYAVGDLIRTERNNILEITSVHENDHYKSGDLWLSESKITPFDGFKIGDTVWTEKRGKGKIKHETIFLIDPERPFVVRFDGEDKDRCPKLTNLIPTEHKYKQAIGVIPIKTIYAEYNPIAGQATKDFVRPSSWYDAVRYASSDTVNVAYNPSFTSPESGKKTVTEEVVHRHPFHCDKVIDSKTYTSKFAIGDEVNYAGCVKSTVSKIHWDHSDRKFLYDLNTNDVPNRLPEYSLDFVRKFKKGDAVFYNRQKCLVKWAYSGLSYSIMLPDCSLARVHESEIRLWKETKFTHIARFKPEPEIAKVNTLYPKLYRAVAYLGKNAIGQDTFSCTTHDNAVVILFGEKGDNL